MLPEILIFNYHIVIFNIIAYFIININQYGYFILS